MVVLGDMETPHVFYSLRKMLQIYAYEDAKKWGFKELYEELVERGYHMSSVDWRHPDARTMSFNRFEHLTED